MCWPVSARFRGRSGRSGPVVRDCAVGYIWVGELGSDRKSGKPEAVLEDDERSVHLG